MTPEERARVEWQIDLPGLGVAGQERLARASVLVSRIGGVGGTAAQQLAHAGVGRLVLAHAGPLRIDDLNRQGLMGASGLGKPRVETAAARLRELQPGLQVVAVGENASDANAPGLVGKADLVVGAAPLFAERLALNRACVKAGKPLVDGAMYGLEVQVTTILPGKTACLACLYPEEPPAWRRRFPVLGAAAGVAGALAAAEAVKLLAGFGEPLAGRLLLGDLRDMSFRAVRTSRRPDCAVCSPGVP
jgi:molybdopterin/thiamine biosynthesis adenylyltransferase